MGVYYIRYYQILARKDYFYSKLCRPVFTIIKGMSFITNNAFL